MTNKCRIFLSSVLLFLSFFIIACTSNSQKMYDYYSVESNFIKVHGIVEEINLQDGILYLNINFDDSTFPNDGDNTFKIIQSNQSILSENDFYDQVNVGDTIDFYSAPRIFGDGYVVPIICIEKDGAIYLPFATGLSNLLIWCTS